MKQRGGFANPEYMIALALAGVALAVMVPACSRVAQRRSNTRALAQLRGALAAYRADHQKDNPIGLEDLTENGRYLSAVPAFSLQGRHGPSARVKPGEPTDDAGGWVYAFWPGGPREGEVWANCTHTDSRGKAWSEY